ncbi:MAG: DNA gyrase inhibitor YacG [Burkholderiales bacterium]|nr:DNA gyrase inhibitor YacG [Burkholderiales bacterium]
MSQTVRVTNHAADPIVTSVTNRTVTCPTCAGDSPYAPSNPVRPFCSERCRNSDFGAWANADFRFTATDIDTVSATPTTEYDTRLE